MKQIRIIFLNFFKKTVAVCILDNALNVILNLNGCLFVNEEPFEGKGYFEFWSLNVVTYFFLPLPIFGYFPMPDGPHEL